MPFPNLRLILIFLLISHFSVAQNITGEVIDPAGRALSGALIHNLSNHSHTHTGIKGNFSIPGKKGDSLQVSHIGFETRILETPQGHLTIRLEEKVNFMDEVVITPGINSLEILSKVNTTLNPVASSQDLLRKVPGLIIGQHAGGGKAEQIFLRGFDIDHGTDIAINVDGMPVNMVSHAHGQGYADLHFLIPETIETVSFGKGPYNAEEGNFATAGFVNFQTKKRLAKSLLKVEVGQFNTRRLLGMLNLLDEPEHHAFAAAEFISTDGAFESPQHFRRINLFGKYSGEVSEKDLLSLSLSHFTSSWDASGQIPLRAVQNGLISRFGAIDDTEGGETSRTNLILEHDHFLDENSGLSNSIYYSRYSFDLFSNFTFFLNDPEFGDQIRQQENRDLFGLNSEYNYRFSGDLQGRLDLGLALRNDRSFKNELAHTLNRLETLSYLSLGDIDETNFAVYADAAFDFGRWTINPGLRLDHFMFNYYNKLAVLYNKRQENKNILSPKLNFLYNLDSNIQFYLKTGKGFHSNDTRVVVSQRGREILPAAYGSDLGFIWKPVPGMLLHSAVWYLYLEQEFIYVGDEGIVEAGGETERKGIDLSLRHQPLSWLYWNLDATYAVARALDATEGEDFIPLAPNFTLTGGVHVDLPSGFYSSAYLRHLNARPANEDNSIIAEGYRVVDFNVGYQWNDLNFGINIQNLFNAEWNETQFATETRLDFEPAPVEEIHFTPGTPFFLKAVVSYSF